MMRRLACCQPVACIPTTVPAFLSSLLHRTRAGLLALLIVVLPLQGVMQLVAGLQGHRHMHAGTVAAAASPSPLRKLLDHLHAAQDPRLQGSTFSLAPSRARMGELHEHGGVYHRHSQDAADVIDVGDATDDAGLGGATAFLAWMPAAPALPLVEACDHRPETAGLGWRDRVLAPPLAPPRG